MNKKASALAFLLGVLALVISGCSQELENNTSLKATPSLSTEIPDAWDKEISYPEAAKITYESMEIPPDFTWELPFAPGEVETVDGESVANAPLVDIPKLKAWIAKTVTEGWVLDSEEFINSTYAARLSKGNDRIYIDAFLDEEDPFTSILISEDPLEKVDDSSEADFDW